MKITVGNSKEFQGCVDAIEKVVSEVKLKIGVQSKSIEITAINKAGVTLVIFKYPASKCTEWELEKDIEVGVNLTWIKNHLKKLKKEDTVTFSMDLKGNEYENLLRLEINGKRKRKFTMALLNLDDVAKEQKEPELKHIVEVQLDRTELKEAVEDCKEVTNSILFEVNEGVFRLTGQGDLNSAEINFEKAEIRKEGNARSKFTDKYLLDILDTKELSDDLLVGLGTDYPLLVEYAFEDGIVLRYILAPRIEK